MFREALVGIVAGAVGTAALNIATYADMAIRARPSSNAPSKMVGILADKAGLALSSKGQGSQDEEALNRESGLGALLGYVNGLGMGVAYGLIRSQLDDVSIPLASVVVGLTAMAASDTPLVALKVSDPRTWGAAGWASDVIPHLIYGLATVAAFELLMNQD